MNTNISPKTKNCWTKDVLIKILDENGALEFET